MKWFSLKESPWNRRLINEDGARSEGVDKITEDGTLVFTDEASNICKELYGISVKEVPLSDMEDLSKEMVAVGKRLVEKYKNS